MDLKPQRIERLLFAGLLVFAFLAACFHISDIDLGYHVRTGAYILEHKQIPSVNTFSSTTPEEPWYLHQWLPAIGLHLLDRLGGVTALTTAKCLLAALAIALLWLTSRRLAGPESLWPFCFLTLAILIGRVRFFERPDFLSSIVFALLFYLDVRHGRRRAWQWAGLPLLFAVWANLHGGIIYGFAFLFALSAGEWADLLWQKFFPRSAGQSVSLSLKELGIRPLGIAFGLLAAVLSTALINPHGAKILLIPFQFSSPFWKTAIVELQRPVWHENQLFYLTLPLLVMLLLLSRQHWSFGRFFVIAGFTVLALDAQRSLLFFAFATAPFAAQMAGQVRPVALPSLKPWQHAVLPALWLALVLVKFVPDQRYRFGYGLYPGFYPTGVFAFMDREVPAQMLFNEMRYGGPLLWKSYPKFKPFIDGRGDAYSVSFWEQEYLPVINLAPGWREHLNRWQTGAVLLPIQLDHQLIALGRELLKDPAWALVAFDDRTMLFLRRNAVNQPVIDKFSFQVISPDDWSLNRLSATTASAALQEAVRVLELSPDSVFGLTAAARATLLRGDYQNALPLYEQLVAVPGANVLYFRDYGFVLWQLDRLEEADKVFRRLQDTGELAGYPAYMRHFIALKQNRPADAAALLQQAITAEPGNAEYQAAQRALKSR